MGYNACSFFYFRLLFADRQSGSSEGHVHAPPMSNDHDGSFPVAPSPQITTLCLFSCFVHVSWVIAHVFFHFRIYRLTITPPLGYVHSPRFLVSSMFCRHLFLSPFLAIISTGLQLPPRRPCACTRDVPLPWPISAGSWYTNHGSLLVVLFCPCFVGYKARRFSHCWLLSTDR
jgi:hypothetical protein